jgi:hypothetical protein
MISFSRLLFIQNARNAKTIEFDATSHPQCKNHTRCRPANRRPHCTSRRPCRCDGHGLRPCHTGPAPPPAAEDNPAPPRAAGTRPAPPQTLTLSVHLHNLAPAPRGGPVPRRRADRRRGWRAAAARVLPVLRRLTADLSPAAPPTALPPVLSRSEADGGRRGPRVRPVRARRDRGAAPDPRGGGGGGGGRGRRGGGRGAAEGGPRAPGRPAPRRGGPRPGPPPADAVRGARRAPVLPAPWRRAGRRARDRRPGAAPGVPRVHPERLFRAGGPGRRVASEALGWLEGKKEEEQEGRRAGNGRSTSCGGCATCR